MISSKKYVDETLKKYNLTANKALGQNFLVESDVANEIVNSASITSQTAVIEIGPGLGALTEFELNQAGKVYAFEIDENMVHILKDTFKSDSNFELNHIDFLQVNIEELIEKIHQDGFTDIVVLSNLPYYITSKILNRILINNYDIHCIITMMQKEVGNKLLKPEKKDYNVLSVILDYQYNISIVKYVGKNSYLPRPEIDSIVLKFEKVLPREKVTCNQLIEVANNLFSARRKTVSNNLKGLFSCSEEVMNCLEYSGIDSATHVEQLTFKQIVKIAEYKNNVTK